MDRSNNLKTKILEYFERKPDIDQDKITKLSFSREISVKHAPLINDKVCTILHINTTFPRKQNLLPVNVFQPNYFFL